MVRCLWLIDLDIGTFQFFVLFKGGFVPSNFVIFVVVFILNLFDLHPVDASLLQNCCSLRLFTRLHFNFLHETEKLTPNINALALVFASR